MPEDGFSVALIFAYKDRIVDFVLLQENTSQGKLYSGFFLLKMSKKDNQCLFMEVRKCSKVYS